MTINVYWACAEEQWLLAQTPEPVAGLFYAKQLYDKVNPDMQMVACPAFRNHLQNVYTLRSLYDYEFVIDNNNVISNSYDQNFFNRHVLIRSIEKKCFSFLQSFVFFTDAPSLETTIGEFPFMEDNNITQRCIPLTGRYDIGKWFRTTEFAFLMRENYNSFKIERQEIFSYIRFHTDEKINFIQFRWNPIFEQYKNDCFFINFFKYMKTLENYYKNFKHKKLILREIEKNIL